MACKTFYTNFEKQKFVEKKIFSNFVYSKHLVRSDLTDSSKIELIDNYTSLTNIWVKDSLKPGVSFFSTRFLFKHKHNDILKFYSFLNYKISINNSREITKLYDSLNFISASKNSLRLMLLLNPVRGGFNAYSCGFLGFLPRSQNKILFKNILSNRFKENSFLSNFLFLSARNQITKNFFSISIPIQLTNTVIYPCYKTPNFSADVAFRRRRFFKNYVNFVFLIKILKKNIQQPNFYENSKLKKRFKSFSYKNKFIEQTLLYNRKSIKRS